MPKHWEKRIEGLRIVYCYHKRKESIFVIQYTRVLIHIGKSDDNDAWDVSKNNNELSK